jgi:hypothetical protein
MSYDIDDTALFAFTEQGHKIMSEQHGSFEIQLNLIPESFHGLHMEGSGTHTTRVVDHNVDGADILLNFCDGGFDDIVFGDIAGIWESSDTLRFAKFLCFREVL